MLSKMFEILSMIRGVLEQLHDTDISNVVTGDVGHRPHVVIS